MLKFPDGGFVIEHKFGHVKWWPTKAEAQAYADSSWGGQRVKPKPVRAKRIIVESVE